MTDSSGWQLVPLGQAIKSAQSGFASGERAPNGVIQIRMNNVTTDGNLDWTSFIRVPTSPKQLAKYCLQPGDVLFNATNSPELVGKTAAFSGHTEPVVFSNHFVRLRVDDKKLDSWYLARWLTYRQQRRLFESLCTQWVNQAAVRKDDLLSLRIPLPPLPEQQRIAAVLAKADRLRRQRRYARHLSDTYLQSVFLQMFGDPVTNPMGWETGKLKGLCDKIVDCPHATPLYSSCETPYACVRSSDIQNGYLDWSTTKYVSADEYAKRIKRHTPMPGEVVYCREGARFGNAARIPPGATVCLGQRIMLFRSAPDTATSEFIWALLESKSVFQQANRLVGGSASPHVNIRDIKLFDVIVPSLTQQQRFSDVVAKYDRLRAQQREAQRQAEHLFQTLLHQAFQGEL